MNVFNGRRCWSRVREMAERSLCEKTSARPVNLKRRPLHGAGTADRIEGPAIENVHYFGFVLPNLYYPAVRRGVTDALR